MNARQRVERRVRHIIRCMVRCRNVTEPVVLVDDPRGAESVGFTGESYHWETRGGRRIHHPSAYSRVGWSNVVYVSSTRQLECGREFYEFLVRFFS